MARWPTMEWTFMLAPSPAPVQAASASSAAAATCASCAHANAQRAPQRSPLLAGQRILYARGPGHAARHHGSVGTGSRGVDKLMSGRAAARCAPQRGGGMYASLIFYLRI